MAHIASHTLRAHATASGGYRAEGWSPAFTLMLAGPTPAGAEMVLAVTRPDGEAWFESRWTVPELAADGWTRVELRPDGGGADGAAGADGSDGSDGASGSGAPGGDLDAAGTALFALRLVSELDGIDEPLGDGVVTAVALAGEQRFALDARGLLGRSVLCLDAVDEPDAPRLRITVFLSGDVEGSRLEAHCFRGGVRFAAASGIQTDQASTANDGAVMVTEVTATFDTVRGWNNLQDSGWGEGWELLDAGDGEYEVKLLCDSRVVRVVAFSVAGGRISEVGAGAAAVEADPWAGWVMSGAATVVGRDADAASTDGASGRFWGFSAAERHEERVGLDDVYDRRVRDDDLPAGPAGPAGPAEAAGVALAAVVGESALSAGATVAGEGAPAEGADEAVRAFVDRAERLLLTWEVDVVGVAPPYDSAQVLTAEAVVREKPGYGELRAAVAAVADEHAVRIAGEPTTVGDLRARVTALFAAAHARVASAGQAEDDVLAPFRAVLSGDKREVFDEHPADAFLYATTDRRCIETPDELAAAEYWYFEGPLDLAGTATADGVQVKVSVAGWRVVGYQFDENGILVDQFENQGQGSSAPVSAYRPHP